MLLVVIGVYILMDSPKFSAVSARSSNPPNVDAAIRKALEPLRAGRFREAGDFAAALSDSSSPHGEAVGVSAATHRQWQARTLAVGVSTVALARMIRLQRQLSVRD